MSNSKKVKVVMVAMLALAVLAAAQAQAAASELIWVPGHYKVELVTKVIPGHFDYITRTVVDLCGHLHVVTERIWIPDKFITVMARIWVPGRWVEIFGEPA